MSRTGSDRHAGEGSSQKEASSVHSPRWGNQSQRGEVTCPRSHSRDQNLEFPFQAPVSVCPGHVPQESKATDPRDRQGHRGHGRDQSEPEPSVEAEPPACHSLLPRLAPAPPGTPFPRAGEPGAAVPLTGATCRLVMPGAGPTPPASAGSHFLLHPRRKSHFPSGLRGPARWMQRLPHPPAPRGGFLRPTRSRGWRPSRSLRGSGRHGLPGGLRPWRSWEFRL